jgi:replicative DNA helicase
VHEGTGQLPQSLESERALLGGLMLDSQQVLTIAETLKSEDFFRESHQHLFSVILKMAEGGEPVETVAVCEKIVAGGTAEKAGGLDYVQRLADDVPSTQNLEYYAGIVRQRSVQRRLISSVGEIAERAREGDKPLAELLDFAETSVFAVTQESAGADWERISEVVDRAFVEIQARSEQGSDVTGVPTGFVDLDRKLAGLHDSDLVILAARPSMGKTALALNMATNAAMSGAGVGIFSLEMSRAQLATRMLCAQARVDAQKVRTGFLSRERDWPKLTEAAEVLYALPLYIDDTPALNITQVRSKARRLKTINPGLKVIMLDYIGLLVGDNRVSRERQVAEASQGLKALAKELEICVVALSQLNRGVEARDNKRPRLSDLRESGSIEQDADVIMFIYRDDYYNKENSAEPGVAEVLIEKQRNGATGSVKLAFQGIYTRFENLAQDPGGGGGYV